MRLSLRKQFTSPSVQNEVLNIMSDLVVKDIVNDVHSSEYFSLIGDETSDISNREQVSVCLRYVFKGEIQERFIGVILRLCRQSHVKMVKK
jgi:hypothetical protein